MAKSKNHTMRNPPQKWHRNGNEKPPDLKFPRSMRVAKKRNKTGLKKTQAADALVEAIRALRKPTDLKAQIPMGVHRKFSRLACTAQPELGKEVRVRTAKGLRLCLVQGTKQGSS
ncbi:60S ribosomal protein L29-like [Echinops telfairi]|uniref:60S ribosomal protein L29-like n=1 Tax=Echinops telfairi TaxID=9371 RepID=A0AC55D3B3_ECHTE|nr:60S ribosomal protein L29-like [Echinops telfairi]